MQDNFKSNMSSDITSFKGRKGKCLKKIIYDVLHLQYKYNFLFICRVNDSFYKIHFLYDICYVLLELLETSMCCTLLHVSHYTYAMSFAFPIIF
jgi:hypothetical protein